MFGHTYNEKLLRKIEHDIMTIMRQSRGLETRQTLNSTYANPNTGLSCQPHMVLYIDCMLLTNQSYHCKSNV